MLIPVFQRRYKIKWWNKTTIDNCNLKGVQNFFKDNTIFFKEIAPGTIQKREEFLAKRQQLMTKMASCTS